VFFVLASINGSVHWNENYAAMIAAQNNPKKMEKIYKIVRLSR